MVGLAGGHPLFSGAGAFALAFSNDKRHEGFHLPAISRILIWKMPHQEAFFLHELDPEANAGQDDAQPTMQPAVFNGRAEAHDQQTRVNGMPHKPIRPGPHKFMALLERDIAARKLKPSDGIRAVAKDGVLSSGKSGPA